MKTSLFLLCATFLPLMACGDSMGASAENAGTSDEQTRIALSAKIPGASPEDLRATPVPGIYELVHGEDISYVTADAAYVFSGDLYQITSSGSFPNLTEARRRELEMPKWQERLAQLAKIPESQMLIFGPEKARHTITVFTDVDCQWCRKLHSQIDDYNKLGIRVRYLFFPRSGPDTESWYRAEAVWCAKDRKQALTRAKNDEPIEMKRCGNTPVARDFALGRQLGVTGTPGVILETGELLPGYAAPEDMLAYIENSLETSPAAN
jgi:thiol:disulfide interchange protein DsbC